MSATLQPAPVVQTNVATTGATSILPASGDSKVYRDLVSLVITSTNAAAATLTITDGTKTVFVLNYPNAAVAPGQAMVLQFNDIPVQQSRGNLAWLLTASANASGFNVTAQYAERQ